MQELENRIIGKTIYQGLTGAVCGYYTSALSIQPLVRVLVSSQVQGFCVQSTQPLCQVLALAPPQLGDMYNVMYISLTIGSVRLIAQAVALICVIAGSAWVGYNKMNLNNCMHRIQ